MTDTETMIAITMPVWFWVALGIWLGIDMALRVLAIYYDSKIFKKRLSVSIIKELESELKKEKGND